MTASFGLGALEMLILLAGGAGLPSNDFVSLVAPADYFAVRKIEATPKKMLEIIKTEPEGGKTPKQHNQQLLAIRWLGENADATKRTDGAREVLEDVAAGKLAKDKFGFAKGHALQALAHLDGKPLPPLSPLVGDLKDEVLKRAGKTANVLGGFDLRVGKPARDEVEQQLRAVLAKAITAKDRAQAYEILDSIGNVRIDRVMIDANIEEKRHVFSLIGAADRENLLSLVTFFLKGQDKPIEIKGPEGEPISIIALESKRVAFAMVADKELIIASTEKEGNAREVLDEALAVRAGKKASAAKGPLADLVKTTPDASRLFAAFELPDMIRKDFTKGNSPFRVAPKRLLFHTVGGEKTTVTLTAEADNADEAKSLVESATALRQMGLKALEKAPPDVPAALVKHFQDVLKAIVFETKAEMAIAKATLDSNKVLGEILRFWIMARPSEKPNPDKP